MPFSRLKRSLFSFIAIIFCYLPVSAATYYNRNGGGSWTNPATWSVAGVNGAAATTIPGANDTVMITDYSADINTTITIPDELILTCKRLVLNNTSAGNSNIKYELIIGKKAVLTVTGNISMTGFSTNENAKLTIKDQAVLNVQGNLATTNASTVIDLADGAGVLNLFGTFTNAGTFTAGNLGSLVHYQGTVAQTVLGLNYYHLTLSNTGAKTFTGTCGIAGIFDPGPVTSANAGTINFNGTGPQNINAFSYNSLTISSARTVNMIDLPAGEIRVAAAFAYSATFSTGSLNLNGNTFVYNGTANQTVTFGSGWKYNRLHINKTAGEALLGNDVTTTNLLGDLIVKAGTLSADNGESIVGNSTATFELQGTGWLILWDDGTPLQIAHFPTGFGTITLSPTSTVEYMSNFQHTIAPQQYGNIVSSENGPRVLSLLGIIRVAGNFASGNSAYSTALSFLEFNGTGPQTLTGLLGSPASPLQFLIINNSGTAAGDGLKITQPIAIVGNLILTQGQLLLNGQILSILNGATNAISRDRGVIISESTDNSSKVQWNIADSLGNHIFPFGKNINEYIPFHFNLISGDASDVIVSTYGTGAANTPLPATVLEIDQQGSSDTAKVVVNRFWQIDVANPTSEKVVDLTFTATNSEVEGIDSLKGRRWNGTEWDAAMASQTFTKNTVTVPGVSSFSPWAVYGKKIPPLPVAGFSADKITGCEGVQVQFTDTSKNNPIAWSWSFPGGNPSSSTLKHPLVTYNTAGIYDVKLEVANAAGIDSLRKTGMITVIQTPASLFSVSASEICPGAIDTITYTGNAGPLATYSWNFDNATILSGSGKGPYEITWDNSSPGTKTITLSVTENTCSSIVTSHTVQVNEVFTNTFTAPSERCAGEAATITYTGNAPVSASYEWDFNGGTIISGSGAGPYEVSWSTPGSAAITLRVGMNNCMSGVSSATVTVYAVPVADFTKDDSVCTGSAAHIMYSGNASAGAAYNWTFNGGTVVSGSGAGPYEIVWNAAGTKSVSLQVEENGCMSAALTQTIEVVEPPVASFSVTGSVCSGSSASVTFTGSASASAVYSWNFDGGTIVSGSGAGPYEVLWNTTGIKNIDLQVTDQGCISALENEAIEVLPVPVASFTLADSVCKDSVTSVTYTGSAAASAAYSWNFDGGIVQSGSGAGPYTVAWNTPGLKSVTLQVTENGCASALQTESVLISDCAMPQASFTSDKVIICEEDSVQFTNLSVNADNVKWIFNGANSNSSTDNDPKVTYAQAGSYAVTLIAFKNSLSDTLYLDNYITVNDCSNAAPVAVDDSVETYCYDPLQIVVLNNDSDPDGSIDASTVEIVDMPDPLFGTAAVNSDGSLQFTPNPVPGFDSLSYRFKDDLGAWSNTAKVYVTIPLCEGFESIETTIAIWPNPVGDVLYIGNNLEKTIEIWAMDGRKVFFAENVEEGRIDLSTLEEGLYTIRVTWAQNYAISKIMIAR